MLNVKFPQYFYICSYLYVCFGKSFAKVVRYDWNIHEHTLAFEDEVYIYIYIYGSVNGLAKNGCFEKKEFRSTPI